MTSECYPLQISKAIIFLLAQTLLPMTGFQNQELLIGRLFTTGSRNWPSGSLRMLVRKPSLVGKHDCRAGGTNRE